jgi:hypothetical protein
MALERGVVALERGVAGLERGVAGLERGVAGLERGVVTLERGAGLRSPRTVIGGVRVTRISEAVVVHGRLLIDGTRAVGGLQHLPGFGV